MGKLGCAAAISAMLMATVPARSEVPGPALSSEAAQVQFVIRCAAVYHMFTFVVRDPPVEGRLRDSSIRWLRHAMTLPPQDKDAVASRFTVEVEALIDLMSISADREKNGKELKRELAICADEELKIFGNWALDDRQR